MTMASCVGKTKAWSSETSVIWPSPHHRSVCGPQAAVYTQTEQGAQNAATTMDQSGRTHKKRSPTAAFCQLNHGWMHLTKPGQKQTKLHTTVIYETLNVIYLQYLSTQFFLSISYDLFIHFPLITPAMCRSVPLSPFRASFHLIQQHHFSGSHRGDSSIWRHSSSNYPPSLKSTRSLMAMKNCSKWLQ